MRGTNNNNKQLDIMNQVQRKYIAKRIEEIKTAALNTLHGKAYPYCGEIEELKQNIKDLESSPFERKPLAASKLYQMVHDAISEYGERLFPTYGAELDLKDLITNGHANEIKMMKKDLAKLEDQAKAHRAKVTGLERQVEAETQQATDLIVLGGDGTFVLETFETSITLVLQQL